MACALDLTDGRLLWRFIAPYPAEAANLAEPPTAPVLMAAADGGGIEVIVFGDPAGRLWALDPDRGAPLGGRPVWQSPGGSDEPIGGGLALRNRLVLLATGGVPHASTERSYAVYAVEILPAEPRLLWTLPLLPGEKLWGAPTFDRFGRAYLGLGNSAAGSGRLLVISADGLLAGSADMESGPFAGLTLMAGAVVTVSRTGQVEVFGELGQEAVSQPDAPGQVRIFSWRMR
jgi:outer membrane protein assembly factor BamB